MAPMGPLVLDTSSWNDRTTEQIQAQHNVGVTDHDGPNSGSWSSEKPEPAQADEEAIMEAPKRTATGDLTEEQKAARRASRKEKGSKRRSLLEEMAADKDMRRRTNSQAIEAENSQDTTGRRTTKANSRLSDERRTFMQSSVDERADAEAEAEGLPTSPSSHSSSSTQRNRVSFEDSEAIRSHDELTSPITIPTPSSSSMSSVWSPHRPSIAPRTLSSNPERRPFRGSSTRSASSSWSPASAFLSKWSRDENVAPTEPDAEGQEICPGSGYIIGRQIGYGGFSVVKEAHSMGKHGERLVRAVKIVRKQIRGQSETSNDRVQHEFEHEVTMWRNLKHDQVLPLLAVFNTDFATFCVMQINDGGTLFDLVAKCRRQKSSGPITMPLSHARSYIAQLASAVRYVHRDARIVHRDIKLENCLVSITESSDGSPTSAVEPFPGFQDGVPYGDTTKAGKLLLCDFGMAEFIDAEDRDSHGARVSKADLLANEDTSASDCHNGRVGPGPNSAMLSTSFSIAGSVPYASPELILSSCPLYETSADMWAFGVVCYALLVGDLPFKHSMEAKVIGMIEEGAWDVSRLKEAIRTSNGSEEDVENATELVEGCLRMDVEARWSVEKVLRCAFLAGKPA